MKSLQPEAASRYAALLVYEDGIVHSTPEARAYEDELRQSHPSTWVRNAVRAGKRDAVERALESLVRR